MSPLVALMLITLAPLIGAFSSSGVTGDDTGDQDQTGEDITGTEDADDLVGTVGDDVLSGLGGNDALNGAAGDDLVEGGDGDDSLEGRVGDDTLLGGAGADSLSGGADDDLLSGGAGDDEMDGGVGDDSLAGGAGADALRGSAGDDTLIGGDADTPFDAAPDTLLGGEGDDLLFLSDGDFGNGGAGADAFQLSAGEVGAITIGDFDVASDVLIIEQPMGSAVAVASQEVTDAGVLVTLDSGATVLLQGLSEELPDTAISFVEAAAPEVEPEEEVEGEDTTPADPTPDPDPTVASFTGTDDDETLEPPADGTALTADLGGGNDSATGADQNDTLAGGTGADTLSGAAGNDILFATSADAAAPSDSDGDSLSGGAGDDTLVMGVGDFAIGGEGADVFALRADVADAVTVDDFDVSADRLVIEAVDPDDVTVLGQTPTAAGLVISLSSGATVVLAGLTEAIDPALIQIETPGTSTTA